MKNGLAVSRPAVVLCLLLVYGLTVPSATAQGTKSGFFKTSDGIKIHYVEAGSGHAVVFIPGYPRGESRFYR